MADTAPKTGRKGATPIFHSTTSESLKQAKRVLDDQTNIVGVPVDLVGRAAVHGMANAQGQIFGRAALHDVLGFQVTFPMFLVTGIGIEEATTVVRIGAVTRNI